MVGGRAGSFREGIELAGELIDSGEAQKKLKRLVEASHEYRRLYS